MISHAKNPELPKLPVQDSRLRRRGVSERSTSPRQGIESGRLASERCGLSLRGRLQAQDHRVPRFSGQTIRPLRGLRPRLGPDGRSKRVSPPSTRCSWTEGSHALDTDARSSRPQTARSSGQVARCQVEPFGPCTRRGSRPDSASPTHEARAVSPIPAWCRDPDCPASLSWRSNWMASGASES